MFIKFRFASDEIEIARKSEFIMGAGADLMALGK